MEGMGLEGFSPLGSNDSPNSYKPHKTQSTNLSASSPAFSYGNRKSNTTTTNSDTTNKLSTSPTRSWINSQRNLNQNEPLEKRIKNYIDTTEGVYTLQRVHGLPVLKKPLKTSFSPLHQPPTRCSITLTPSYFSEIIFEGKSERICQNQQQEEQLEQVEENKNNEKENYLLVYNTKDGIFIDRYYHQHKQLYTINARPIIPQTSTKPTQSIDTNQTKKLHISTWPHHIHCKRYPSSHLFYHSSSSELNYEKNKLEERLFFIVIGFTTGEIIVYEPWQNTLPAIPILKVTQSCVLTLQWLPKNEGKKLICGLADGSILFFDLTYKTTSSSVPSSSTMIVKSKNDVGFSIWRNSTAHANPYVKWQICDDPIHDIKFSPSGDYLAIACGDGYVRMIDMDKGHHLPYDFSSNGVHSNSAAIRTSIQLGSCSVAFQSFFGGLLCVAWSPDGKYFITGGEDDFVSVWSFRKCKIMARGQGHRSWISSVAFDPWLCNEENYRFASVGQDGRMLLWDYSSDNLARPRRASRSSLLFSRTKKKQIPGIPVNKQDVANSPNADFQCDSYIVTSGSSKEVWININLIFIIFN